MSERKRRHRQWRGDGDRIRQELAYAAQIMSDNRHVREDLVAEGVVAVWLLPSDAVARAPDPLELQLEAGVNAMKAWMRHTRGSREAIPLDDPTLSEELICSDEQAQSYWPVLLRAA